MTDLDELERLRAVAEQQLGTRELGSTYLYETDVDAYMTALRNSAEELIRDARRYRELLMAVGAKWPNETRHKTALRYIQRAEAQQLLGGQPIAQERKE